ncbi:MAG: hypothetical protein E7632_11695 [Ruminococcaceae bacterium]|nr:hypothetical protein [Oscillospiraceae bacterium]
MNEEESSEIINIIFDSQTFDTGVNTWTDARRAYLRGTFFKFDDTLISTTDTVKPLMEAAIEATIEALAE